MKTFEINTLPRVMFAHIYNADSYNNILSAKDSSIEISFISEGTVTIEYDQKEYIAQKDDIICLPRNKMQVKIKAEQYHEHHTILARCEWSTKNDTNGLYLPVVTPAHLNTKNAEAIIDLLVRNKLLYKESPTKGAMYFLQLLCEIDYCNRKIKKANLPSETMYAKRAKEYVQNNLRSPITQKGVAEQLGISPEYLCAIFKKSEDVTFIKYVNTEKLEAIKSLMEKEHIHLYEAASLFGYADPNYVSRLFKKHYGYNITENPNYFKK